MNAVFLSMAAVFFSLLLAWRCKKVWVRLLITTTLFLHICLIATFGMGGLRAHIEQARAEGKSEQYVAGLVDRNRIIYFSRLEILVAGTGLFLLGFFGWAARKR
jgi:hypothetical protein